MVNQLVTTLDAMLTLQIHKKAAHPMPNAPARTTALFCFLALAGCDNSESSAASIQGDPTPEQLAAIEAQTTLASTFATPDQAGKFTSALTPVFSGSFKDASGNGYAYEVTRSGTAFAAHAGILPGTAVGPLPTQGIAAMSGVWQLAEIGKTTSEGREYGEAMTHSGRIQLRANFATGTLDGTSEDLVVVGSFTGPTLGGNVYFKQQPASLTGRIGSDRTVGAFHGATTDTTFAGGFLAEQ